MNRACALLTATLALAACSDVTEPVREVTIHVAHAATGAGPFAVTLNGTLLEPALQPGGVATETIRASHYDVRLEGAITIDGGSSLAPLDDGAEVALILRDAAEPGLRLYHGPSPGVVAEVTLRVINMARVEDATLVVGDAVTLLELGYGDDRSMGLDAGAYAVTASWADGAETADLGTVSLAPEHDFLLVVPSESGAPASVVAF